MTVSDFNPDRLIALTGGRAQFADSVRLAVAQLVHRGTAPLADVQQLLDSGQGAEAARILHGLRGAIGTLGAVRFAEAALEFENAIRRSPGSEPAPSDARVRAEFSEVLEAAAAWLAQQAVPAPAPPATLETAALVELRGLLEQRSTRAGTLFSELKTALIEHLSDAEIARVQAAIDEFDFERALALLPRER